MHCYIVFAHPSKTSFTAEVLTRFTDGLTDAKHTYEIGDLYKMRFNPVMGLNQYRRETRITENKISRDVRKEHVKIQKSDVLVFIYPNWWSDCPAILKGWFDKVWSYGFAYHYVDNKRFSYIKPKNALVICTAGYTDEALEENGIGPSMKKIMINDRLKNQAFEKIKMEFLGGMSVGKTEFKKEHLEHAYTMGKNLMEFIRI